MASLERTNILQLYGETDKTSMEIIEEAVARHLADEQSIQALFNVADTRKDNTTYFELKTVFLSPELDQKLIEARAATGLKKDDILRRCVFAYLDESFPSRVQQRERMAKAPKIYINPAAPWAG